MGQSKQVKKLIQELLKDGYNIEVELQRLKRFMWKVKNSSLLQGNSQSISLKIQVAQKKVKIAFENVDSSSRVELIPSKIKYAIKVVLSFHNKFSVFSSLSRKENDGLLQDQVFKNKEEVVIKSYLIRIVPN
nr:hypothetical protein [Tanacetum cinerariifolium]